MPSQSKREKRKKTNMHTPSLPFSDVQIPKSHWLSFLHLYRRREEPPSQLDALFDKQLQEQIASRNDGQRRRRREEGGGDVRCSLPATEVVPLARLDAPRVDRRPHHPRSDGVREKVTNSLVGTAVPSTWEASGGLCRCYGDEERGKGEDRGETVEEGEVVLHVVGRVELMRRGRESEKHTARMAVNEGWLRCG